MNLRVETMDGEIILDVFKDTMEDLGKPINAMQITVKGFQEMVHNDQDVKLFEAVLCCGSDRIILRR